MADPARYLSPQAQARIGNNLFLRRMQLGHTQQSLGALALVSKERISELENGGGRWRGARLDIYVRLAGALGLSVGDLVAGVAWTPPMLDSEIEGGYEPSPDNGDVA